MAYQRTKMWAQPPRVADRSFNLAFKEEDDLLHPGYSSVNWNNSWPPGEPALRLLFFNKHYSHALDYFQTIREHGPKQLLTTGLYNVFFATLEGVGTPGEVVKYFEDFHPDICKSTGVHPDATTYGFLVKAHCALKDLDAAMKALNACKNAGLVPTARTYAVLIDHLIVENHPDESLLNYLVKELTVMEEKKEAPDVEYFNTMIFLKGSKDLRAGEEIFKRLCGHPVLAPNYNSYQRLIEMYALHKRFDRMCQTLTAMKNDNMIPNDLTKFTFFQSFINTGDRRLLYAVQITWPKDVYDLDHHAKFFREWLYTYRSGGGDLPITDELLETKDVGRLEEAFMAAHWDQSGGPGERWKPLFDSFPDVYDIRQIIDEEELLLSRQDDPIETPAVIQTHEMGTPFPKQDPPSNSEEEAEAEAAKTESPDPSSDDPFFVPPKKKREFIFPNPLLQDSTESGAIGGWHQYRNAEKTSETIEQQIKNAMPPIGEEEVLSDGDNEFLPTSLSSDTIQAMRDKFTGADASEDESDQLAEDDDEDEEEAWKHPDYDFIRMSEDGYAIVKLKEPKMFNKTAPDHCSDLSDETELDSDDCEDPAYKYPRPSHDEPIDAVGRDDVVYFQNSIESLARLHEEKYAAQSIKKGMVKRDIASMFEDYKRLNPGQERMPLTPELKELRTEFSDAKHGEVDDEELGKIKQGVEGYLHRLKITQPEVWEDLHNEYRRCEHGDVPSKIPLKNLVLDPFEVIKSQLAMIDIWCDDNDCNAFTNPLAAMTTLSGDSNSTTSSKHFADRWGRNQFERATENEFPRIRIASLNVLPAESTNSFPLHSLSAQKAREMLDELDWDPSQPLEEEVNLEEDLLPSQRSEYPHLYKEEDEKD